MTLFDVPEGDRWIIWLAAITGAVIVLSTLLVSITEYSSKADAFKNGYEQVVDPINHNVLWKKSRKE